MNNTNKIQYWMTSVSLHQIIMIAFVVRLVQVFTSNGFGMHDEHYEVMQPAWHIWKYGSPEYAIPGLFGWVQKGFYLGLYHFCALLGVTSTFVLAKIGFFIQALISLFSVKYSFKIAEKLQGRKLAVQIGWVMAVMPIFPRVWLLPFAELNSLPLLLVGVWHLLKHDQLSYKAILWSGLAFGAAAAIRPQAALIVLGVGLAFMIKKEWKIILLPIGFALSFFIMHSGDLFLWGEPLVEFRNYLGYNSNSDNAGLYISLPWYMTTIQLFGALILPPLSFILLFGIFVFKKETWKNQLVLFLPILIFIVFHSSYENKQERFMMTIVPFVSILGLWGWNMWQEKSMYWKKHKTLLNRLHIVFFVLCGIYFVIQATWYQKRERIETMLLLKEQGDCESMILDHSEGGVHYFIPYFYLENNAPCYFVSDAEKRTETARERMENRNVNYIIISGTSNKENRLDYYLRDYPNLKLIGEIEPSWQDLVLHKVNPFNKNGTQFIYKVK